MRLIREQLDMARTEREAAEARMEAHLREAALEEEAMAHHEDLENIDAAHSRADEERRTLVEQNERLQIQLASLSSELRGARDDAKVTGRFGDWGSFEEIAEE